MLIVLELSATANRSTPGMGLNAEVAGYGWQLTIVFWADVKTRSSTDETTKEDPQSKGRYEADHEGTTNCFSTIVGILSSGCISLRQMLAKMFLLDVGGLT
jgi:hypothetical protein